LKKIFLPIVILIICALSVSAADVEVSHQLLTKDVYPGESVNVNIIVKNNQDTDDVFIIKPDLASLYPLLSRSAFKEVYPPSMSNKLIKAHEEGIFTFSIKVREGIEPDWQYTLKFNIKSQRDEEINIPYEIRINVISPEELIKITTNLPDKVMPGQKVTFYVAFKNQANLLIDPADLYIDSDLFSKYYSEKIYPMPYEVKKTLEFSPEPTVPPGKYEMVVTAFKGKTLGGRFVKEFEVVKNLNIESDVQTTSGFLTRTITVTRTNKGNTASNEKYEMPITWFEKLMTNFNEEPQMKKPGQVTWMFTVNPNETRNIVIKTDYRALFFTVIGVLILAIVMVYFIRRAVHVKKGAFKLRDEKGAIAELKVVIHVANKTTKPITEVKIVDILPNILVLDKDFGTLKPTSFQKGEKTSRIVWEIDELEPGEERVVSYKAKPGLHVIGGLVLPAALVRYNNKDRKSIDVQSNKVSLMAPQPKKLKHENE